jgi:hypothetical protein
VLEQEERDFFCFSFQYCEREDIFPAENGTDLVIGSPMISPSLRCYMGGHVISNWYSPVICNFVVSLKRNATNESNEVHRHHVAIL